MIGINRSKTVLDRENEEKSAFDTLYNPFDIQSNQVLDITSRIDVVERMRHNMSQLKDLQGRLSFLLKEVKGVLKA